MISNVSINIFENWERDKISKMILKTIKNNKEGEEVCGAQYRGAPGTLLQASVGEHHCMYVCGTMYCKCVRMCHQRPLTATERWTELLIGKELVKQPFIAPFTHI